MHKFTVKSQPVNNQSSAEDIYLKTISPAEDASKVVNFLLGKINNHQ